MDMEVAAAGKLTGKLAARRRGGNMDVQAG